ncbi:MAG: FKBP-type peptidyl-prolyl cis-trans isomerase [Candidatus Nanoarchaeia archaeon]
MSIQKNDFIEIEFTGLSNGEIFDTTDKEQAKKIGLEADVKPLIISVGNEMLLKGLDNDLIGKEISKKYSVHLTAQNAFGLRDSKLIKTMPIRVFKEKDIMPVQGMTFQFDNYIAKILSVSGGRVITDFNNPLAGKEIDYNYTIKRLVEDDKEKVNSLLDFFFKQRFEFEIDKSAKKVIFKDEKLENILRIFGKKFKEITGLDFEVKKEEKTEQKDKKEEKVKNPQNN